MLARGNSVNGLDEWGLKMVCTAHPTCHWPKAENAQGFGDGVPKNRRIFSGLGQIFSSAYPYPLRDKGL